MQSALNYFFPSLNMRICNVVASGARFSKVPKTLRARIVKLRPAYSVKLVLSYVVKGIEMKITAKFRASRRFHFEDTGEGGLS